ncbi:bifunctional glutamate N-acetyltransferase/amino-acid acetyltransferase ArgJ [Maridesulfovibrio bastinii]|uniref:bifunctional glutamate N-acetyltransferase/amino-acid acetyltransferase ArgJ n=1 Tax=Maridesulfovibrio bastinii TaxID=47157 RepID=UPI00041DA780|nr:bifunctional glutamate N-acetyltransferase/amino-acid acetyltransferase ArgJ [Maridesulfovibrio bastinii]
MIPVPKGYKFSAAAAGFKYKDRNDLALICSDVPATAAGVFTTNRFQAAPITVCKANLEKDRKTRALMINAGLANACTGNEGIEDCRRTTEMVSKAIGIESCEILPASTGVIGNRFDLSVWEAAVPKIAEALGSTDAVKTAKAIMTTDTFPKLSWKKVDTANGSIRLLGMCKGSGMICPKMATMLGFVICDADVDPDWWQETLARCIQKSFNCVTVDGDTSTNDCVLALANGASGVKADSDTVKEALEQALLDICQALSYMIIQDAEGGTKVMSISVTGAESDEDAELVARAVGNSPLVKTAIFGEDPNWGRIVAAAGRSEADFDPDMLTLAFGDIIVFEKGCPIEGDIDAVLAPLMKKQDIAVNISLGNGTGKSSLLASDFTHDYVSINADYRS